MRTQQWTSQTQISWSLQPSGGDRPFCLEEFVSLVDVSSSKWRALLGILGLVEERRETFRFVVVSLCQVRASHVGGREGGRVGGGCAGVSLLCLRVAFLYLLWCSYTVSALAGSCFRQYFCFTCSSPTQTELANAGAPWEAHCLETGSWADTCPQLWAARSTYFLGRPFTLSDSWVGRPIPRGFLHTTTQRNV